ncbi:hypothetical protein CEXT_668391 [Caerostris extrusa]|uniref:Uncharacterized protein n=1 Tax=Caerostris extrusa TaxID=172846 RepID=A0AAV4UBF3_CAEEX|nr:hypothetical protein CEXT_668391 [Caerostris extrusa]
MVEQTLCDELLQRPPLPAEASISSAEYPVFVINTTITKAGRIFFEAHEMDFLYYPGRTEAAIHNSAPKEIPPNCSYRIVLGHKEIEKSVIPECPQGNSKCALHCLSFCLRCGSTILNDTIGTKRTQGNSSQLFLSNRFWAQKIEKKDHSRVATGEFQMGPSIPHCLSFCLRCGSRSIRF